jgi:hypothetical protein
LLDTEDSLFQRKSHVDAQVPSVRRLLALLTTKPPHETAKEVSNVKAPERLAGTTALRSPGLARTRETSGASLAVGIILLSLCRITEGIVRLIHVRHVPGCLGIILVEVGMILLDQFTIGLLDIILGGPPGYSHNIIVVSISHHIDLHSGIGA